MKKEDSYWMQEALKLARHAAVDNEVPVGSVVVLDGKIIGSGFNSCIKNKDPSGHAEILALRQAAANIGNYRLINTTLYVTLEPCVMCVGAMIHARIARLVFGAKDPKTGAIESVVKLLSYNWNHKINYQSGILDTECSELLKEFFQKRR